MHQTFYIDADEEISSVIDRLNKSMSPENYFVVPKRAIFLQSIVNLKLLKREADKLGKRLTIVTQDEIGASMAKRSGLEVKHAIEGLDSNEIEEVFHVDESGKEPDFFNNEVSIEDFSDKKNRLNAVGSSDFFDDSEKIVEKSTQTSIRKNDHIKRVPINGVAASQRQHLSPSKRSSQHTSINNIEIPKHSRAVAQSSYKGKIDPGKERILEKMFAGAIVSKKESEPSISGANGATKKIFTGFVVVCFFALVGIATYLYLPNAKLMLSPNISTEKVDLVILGKTDTMQPAQKIIQVRVVEKEQELSITRDVAGSVQGNGKKARGTVVVYNEYNSSPQTLIATTRLESADGKIFRLAKNIVVPGATAIGGQIKPGAIEVEVVADQAGGDYNLAPSSFTIPGFKGGPKFEKFYAKSTENFVGGSLEGGTTSGVISQGDIDGAKREVENALKEQIRKEITEELGEGEILLTQAEKFTLIKTGANAKVGDLTEKLEYGATISAKMLIFSEKEVKSVIEEAILGQQNLENAEWVISKLEYGATVADFDQNTLEMKIHSELSITSIIDTNKVKKDLLGKKADELESILKNYPSIRSASVEFHPTIVSRIPQYSSRVTVEIDKTPK